MAHQGEILLPPGRNLTNLLVVYDREYPAPAQLKESWERFQKGSRPTPDKSVLFDRSSSRKFCFRCTRSGCNGWKEDGIEGASRFWVVLPREG
ncbi:hypothetical protein QUA81_07035 [Microcoleus sp. F6_B4]